MMLVRRASLKLRYQSRDHGQSILPHLGRDEGCHVRTCELEQRAGAQGSKGVDVVDPKLKHRFVTRVDEDRQRGQCMFAALEMLFSAWKGSTALGLTFCASLTISTGKCRSRALWRA
jgi:hypothetical protein